MLHLAEAAGPEREDLLPFGGGAVMFYPVVVATQ